MIHVEILPTEPSAFGLFLGFRTLAGMVALKVRTGGSKSPGIITQDDTDYSVIEELLP